MPADTSEKVLELYKVESLHFIFYFHILFTYNSRIKRNLDRKKNEIQDEAQLDMIFIVYLYTHLIFTISNSISCLSKNGT